MTKTLVKKQMLEVFAWIYQDRKTGQNRTKAKMLRFGIVCAIVVAYLEILFYNLSNLLAEVFVPMGYGWVYMAMMGITGVTLGVFGSVFSTYSTLYQAKDNDLLLSMPVPVKIVLFARLSGVYVMGLVYELLVMVPAVIVYFRYASLSVLTVIFCLLIPFVLSLFVLTLSCVLGWIVAIISSRLKNQKIITVLFSLVFMGAYFYFCGNASNLLQSVLSNPGELGEKIKGVLYPLYHMGMAAEGNALSMLIFTAILAGVFAVVYLILAQSFLKLATANRGISKVKYVEKKARILSPARALFGKEERRFVGSVNYMLNCGLGVVFLLVAAVFLIIKRNAAANFALLMGDEDFVALLLAAAVCMMTAMIDYTAPSVSLEGKNIWLVHVMPVSGWQVLKAKLNFHLVLTLVPTVVLLAAIEFVFRPSPLNAVLIPVLAVLYVVLMAAIGLVCNLKMPNLEWTNESVPIKQSASVMISLFGGWGIIVLFAIAYSFLPAAVTPLMFMLGICVLLIVVDIFLLHWLRGAGAKIFENL